MTQSHNFNAFHRLELFDLAGGPSLLPLPHLHRNTHRHIRPRRQQRVQVPSKC